MVEQTKMTPEARDRAVRRTLELLRGDEILGINIPQQGPFVAETLEQRAAVLRRAMDQMSSVRGGCLFDPPAEWDYKQALAHLEALIAHPWEDTPENLCLRALALDSIAKGRNHLGDVAGCIAARREAAALAAAAGPELEGKRCDILLSLAHILSKNGAREESLAAAREAAELAAGMGPDHLYEASGTFRYVTDIFLKNGALEDSLMAALKAVEIAKRVDEASYEDSVPELPEALLRLADVHHLRGELAAAEGAVRRAKAIWEALPLTWMKDEVGTCLDKLACLREELGDTAGSLALRREAVAFWRHEEGSDWSESPRHIDELAKALGNLGTALAREGQWREACAPLEEALALYVTTYLKHHENPEATAFAATLEECRRARREALNGKEEIMETSPEREAVLDEIIERELAMFLATPNEGGEASCQQRPNTFRVMRRMAHIIHEDETLKSYLEDLRAAEESGRNFMIEKYARMDDRIPPLSESHLLDEIVRVEDDFMHEAAQQFPDRIRLDASAGFSHYLRCELETLSQRTLELYAREVRLAKAQGRNLVLERHQWLADYMAAHPRG